MTVPPLTRHKRQRNGKIARLPEVIRERINVMIEDGVRYRDIIKALAQPGGPALPYPLSEMNLSNWRKGGHQEWLRRQQQLELNRKLPLAYPETHPSSATCSSCSKSNSPVVRHQKSKPEHDPSKFEHAPHIRLSRSPRSSALRTPHSAFRTPHSVLHGVPAPNRT